MEGRLTISEFRDLGLLLEVNRRVLHPLGLALEASVPEEACTRLDLTDDGVEMLRHLIAATREREPGLAEEMDALEQRLREADRIEAGEPVFSGVAATDDEEGFRFDQGTFDELAPQIERGQRLLAERAPIRLAALGYVEQPLPNRA